MSTVARSTLGWLGALVALTGALVASVPTGASPVPPLVRIRAAPRLTESAGTAHFVSDVRLGTVPGTRVGSRISSVGDVALAGPDVSLTDRVSSTSTSDAPMSEQIIIGKTFYIRYVNPALAPGPWSKGTTRQPYPYLGVVEPRALAMYRGSVRTVGITSVDGQPATGYALSIPGTDSLEPLPQARTQHITVKPITLEVWLDRSGRIVRTFAVTVVEDGTRTVTSKTTVTLSRFGEPIHIVAPQPLVPS